MPLLEGLAGTYVADGSVQAFLLRTLELPLSPSRPPGKQHGIDDEEQQGEHEQDEHANEMPHTDSFSGGERPGVYHCRGPRGNLQMSYRCDEELTDAELEAAYPGILDELRGMTDAELEVVVRRWQRHSRLNAGGSAGGACPGASQTNGGPDR